MARAPVNAGASCVSATERTDKSRSNPGDE